MKYLIDSDWTINCLRGDVTFLQKLAEFNPEGMTMSVISMTEIYNGIYGSRSPLQDEEAFRVFLRENSIKILNIEEETSLTFSRERMRLRQSGTPIGDMDTLIAATALQYGLVLLTNNVRHFRRVPGLEIISI